MKKFKTEFTSKKSAVAFLKFYEEYPSFPSVLKASIIYGTMPRFFST